MYKNKGPHLLNHWSILYIDQRTSVLHRKWFQYSLIWIMNVVDKNQILQPVDMCLVDYRIVFKLCVWFVGGSCLLSGSLGEGVRPCLLMWLGWLCSMSFKELREMALLPLLWPGIKECLSISRSVVMFGGGGGERIWGWWKRGVYVEKTDEEKDGSHSQALTHQDGAGEESSWKWFHDQF